MSGGVQFIVPLPSHLKIWYTSAASEWTCLTYKLLPAGLMDGSSRH